MWGFRQFIQSGISRIVAHFSACCPGQAFLASLKRRRALWAGVGSGAIVQAFTEFMCAPAPSALAFQTRRRRGVGTIQPELQGEVVCLICAYNSSAVNFREFAVNSG
jgi:hypothetical protein